MQSTKGLDLTAKVVVTKAGQKYSPSANTAQGNGATWETITAALAQGPQSVAALQKLAKDSHNHAPFVGYCIRRGWLAIK